MEIEMTKRKKSYLFIATLLMTFFITGCGTKSAPSSSVWANHDRRTAGTFVDDQAILIKANLAIARDKALWKDSHISTLSYNNSLLLVGQTSSAASKRQAEKTLDNISEIEHVYNELTVDKPIPLSARAKDTWITTQVKTKMLTNGDIGPNRVKVITENSVVYLMGILSKDEESIAIDIARRINGVKQVVKVFDRFEQLG